jgi:hypothetical protein
MPIKPEHKPYNNGVVTKYALECPEGFIPGTLQRSNAGRKWYTNGVDNKMAYECPEGYHEGKTMTEGNLQGYKKVSVTNKKKRWYTNGVENVFTEQCPEGYLEGVARDEPARVQKSRQTCLEKYGVDNPSKAQVVREKISAQLKGRPFAAQKYYQEKYGVVNVTQLPEIIEKRRQNSLERYGVDCPQKLLEVKEKARQTVMSRGGYEEMVKKSHATQRRNGGIGFANPITKQKYQQTMIERYGAYNALLVPELVAKNTNVKVYDTESFVTQARIVHGNRYDYSKVRYTRIGEAVEIVCPVHGSFTQEAAVHIMGHGCQKCGTHRSHREVWMEERLKELGEEVQTNARLFTMAGLKQKVEMDLYLPQRNIGIEFNGYLSHSTIENCVGGGKAKSYHKDKTEAALREGIRLYHFWEDAPEELVLSIIKAKLGLNEKIGARELRVIKGPAIECEVFFNCWHLDGAVAADRYYALGDDEGIKCALSVRKNKECVEIARFASMGGITVLGGYARLFERVKEDYKGQRIITYCNRDLSPDPSDTVYAKMGLSFVRDCGPMLKYYVGKGFTDKKGVWHKEGVHPRQEFMKYKLEDYWDDVDMSLFADVICGRHEVYPAYNSGNFLYSLDT